MAMKLSTARTATNDKMADPWEAVEYPPGTGAAVKEYLSPRSFMKRGFYPMFEEEGPIPSYEDIITGKADAEIDMPMAPAISPLALRRTLRGAVRMRAKRFKFGPERLEHELGQVDRLVDETPPGLAEWIRSFKLKSKIPGAQEGHGYYFPKRRQAYADPYSMKYEVGPLAAHELHGHATQDVFRHRAPVGGALGKVQLKVDEAVVGIHQMRAQLDYLERLGAISGNLAKEHRAASIEKILETADSGERIANSIETAMGKGVNYRDAVKAAYREARSYVPSDLRQLRNAAKQVEDMMLEAGEVFFQPF